LISGHLHECKEDCGAAEQRKPCAQRRQNVRLSRTASHISVNDSLLTSNLYHKNDWKHHI